tara:strand:- start:2087 stop:2293 length:207 start_codon:yes stop_codon:yes gene_type:complete
MIPSEYNIGGVYLPPLLVVALLALAATWVTATLLNRHRLSRFFFYPPLVYLALLVIYSVIIGTFIIPV